MQLLGWLLRQEEEISGVMIGGEQLDHAKRLESAGIVTSISRDS